MISPRGSFHRCAVPTNRNFADFAILAEVKLMTPFSFSVVDTAGPGHAPVHAEEAEGGAHGLRSEVHFHIRAASPAVIIKQEILASFCRSCQTFLWKRI